MADDNEIKVILGAQTEQLKAGMEESAATVKAATAQMTASFQEMSAAAQATVADMKATFMGLQTVVLGVVAAITTGWVFKDMVAATQEWVGQAASLSRVLGITTGEATALNVAVRELSASLPGADISVQNITMAVQMMNRQLATNETNLNNWGIKTREVNGEFRNSFDIFMNALAVIRNLDGATAQNVAGAEIFKRSWREVRPLMGLTEEGLEAARQKAMDLGLYVGKDGVETSKKYRLAMEDLKLESKAFANTLGTEVIPVVTRIVSWFNQGFAAARKFSAAMKEFGPEMTHEQFMGFKAAPPPKEERPPGGGAEIPVSGGGKGGGGPSLLQQWKEELDQIKTLEDSFLDFSKAREKEFWEDKLRQCKEGSKEYIEVRKEIFNLDKAMAKEAVTLELADLDRQMTSEKTNWKQRLALEDEKLATLAANYGKDSTQYAQELKRKETLLQEYDKFEREVAQKAIDNELKLGLMSLKAKEDEISFKQKMGMISSMEEARQLAEVKKQELALEEQSLQKSLSNWQGYEKKLQEIREKEKEFAQKKANETVKIEQDAALKQMQAIESILSPIQSAIDTSITGIIQGTQTLSKAIENLGMAILSSITGFLSKMVMQWLAAYVAVAIFGKASAKDQIGSQAGVIYTENLVELIPEVGPWFAPEVAAGLTAGEVATAMGMTALDKGAWDIPREGMALLHPGEAVFPAGVAAGVRTMVEGGGGGGNVITVNPVINVNHAMTQSEWNSQARMMLKAINRELATFGKNPLGPAYI